MIELFRNITLHDIGWMGVQFAWISTLLLAVVIFVLRQLNGLSARTRYNIGLVTLAALGLLPLLLMVRHRGILPPVGLADWGSPSSGTVPPEPMISDLPRITGFNPEHLLPAFYDALGFIMAVGMVAMVGYYAWSVILLAVKSREKPVLRDEKLSNLLEQLVRRLNLSVPFRLRACEYREGPAVGGGFIPTLFVPENLTRCYESDELRVILMHELVHIRRRDHLAAHLQRLVQALFFFQPLVWWLNRLIDEDREQLCDRIVTDITQDAHFYGSTLVKLHLHSQPAMVRSLQASGPGIVNRVKALVEEERSPAAASGKRLRQVLAALLIGAALLASGWNAYHLHPSHLADSGEIVKKEPRMNTDFH